MKKPLLSFAACLFVAHASAQVTFVGNGPGNVGVGSPQVMPDPFDATQPSGDVSLFVDLCSGPGLYCYATGIAAGYVHGSITQDTMVFALNFGNANTTPTQILGGDFFIQLSPAPTSFVIGPVVYIGPVGCGSGAGVFGANLLGAFLDLTAIIPGTFQNVPFSIQACLLDSNLGQIFTSNAVNFQV
jgi:hypothetical protein